MARSCSPERATTLLFTSNEEANTEKAFRNGVYDTDRNRWTVYPDTSVIDVHVPRCCFNRHIFQPLFFFCRSSSLTHSLLSFFVSYHFYKNSFLSCRLTGAKVSNVDTERIVIRQDTSDLTGKTVVARLETNCRRERDRENPPVGLLNSAYITYISRTRDAPSILAFLALLVCSRFQNSASLLVRR